MRARVLASVLAVNAAMVSPSSARVCWISCRVWSKLLLSGGVLMTVSDSLRHVSSRRRLARCLWLLLFIPLAGPAPSGSTDTPGFVGAAPTSPALPGSGCPQLHRPTATGSAAKVSHLHSKQQRLTAHTSETSPSVKTYTRPAPAPAPPSSQPCVTPRSATTALTATPTSPAQPDAPTAAHTTSSPP